MTGVMCQECKEGGFTNLAFGRCKYCKDETTGTYGMPLCMRCFYIHRNLHRLSAKYASENGRFFNRRTEWRVK